MEKYLKQKREEYLSSAKSIDECLLLFSNITHGCYEWYLCKGKNDCLIQLVGNNKNEIIIHVPYYDRYGNPKLIYTEENKKYNLKENFYIEDKYVIRDDRIEFSDFIIDVKIDILKLLKTKDFRTWKFKYKTVMVPIEFEKQGKLLEKIDYK